MLGLLLASATPLRAQNTVEGVPNALQGFSQNRDKPIRIEAAELTMRDKKKEANFKGNVRVIQGDTTMTARTLDVYYESKDSRTTRPGPKMQSSGLAPGAGGSSQIRRLVARGSVVVTQKEQRVSADIATFDAQSNQITMSGNVILSQTGCGSTLKGDRLKVDMTSGVSQVESDTRISAEFNAGCTSKGEATAPGRGPAKPN